MNELQLDKFSTFLSEHNYSKRTIEIYSESLIGFSPLSLNTPTELYKEMLQYERMIEPESSKTVFNNTRAALHLYFFMETGITFRDYKKELNVPTNSFQHDLLDCFCQFSIEFKKISKSTAISERNHVKEFLEVYSVNSAEELSSISIDTIRDYISSHMKELKLSTRGRYITSLRNFFRYLEYIQIPIDKAIIELPLTIANWNNRPPVILSKEEETRLRNFYNEDSVRDVRNKLIILMQLDLGLRCSEIPKLKLSDIRYSLGSILISDTKTKIDREIPLTYEIGSLLEKYIMHFRGITSNQSLFLSINPRKQNCSLNTKDVSRVVRHAMKKAGITGYWKGTHSLRRTAASKIYNSKAGLKVTADILGHASLDSTVHYVKVDFESMKSITTPWPGGEQNDQY